MRIKLTKESTIKKTYGSENLPSPLFAKEGDYSSLLPAAQAPALRVGVQTYVPPHPRPLPPGEREKGAIF